jgi:hypothetical protein
VALSQATGQTLTEAQNINLALTVLGDVLSALSKQHKAGVPPNKQFVPYRNSKLTHLLKVQQSVPERWLPFVFLTFGCENEHRTRWEGTAARS